MVVCSAIDVGCVVVVFVVGAVVVGESVVNRVVD